ncbi:MAG: DUF222 domain-containing protein [Ilumatobacteraceae bacterium]
MQVTVDFSEIITRLDSSDLSGFGENEIREALGDIASIQTWVDQRKIDLTRRLQQLASQSPSINPQHMLATTGKTSRYDAYREMQRASTLDQFPDLAKVFASGQISSAHLDVMARTLHQLDPLESFQLSKRGEWLNTIATHTTPDNFARAIKHEVARIHNDGGAAKLERQRRDALLQHWVDRDSGMIHLHGRLDPESGLRVIGRIEQTVEQLFHGAIPDNCPIDDRKQGHLTALALVAIVDGTALVDGESRSSPNSRAEVSIVIDYLTLVDGLHEHSVLHSGFETELPLETVRRMACEAEIIPVVLGKKGVVLDIGRSSRLASRYQRLAIGAMYTHCAIPNCHISINRCQPHHIRFWRDGGRSDLTNLVPLCATHHRNVHEDRWSLVLDPQTRQLTVGYPDGESRIAIPQLARSSLADVDQ